MMLIKHCTLAEWMREGPAAIAAGWVGVLVITDRKPAWSGRRWYKPKPGKYYWTGVGEALISTACQLPDEIWDRLHVPTVGTSLYYDSEDEARADLHRACVEWAAEKAAEAARQSGGVQVTDDDGEAD